jgi:CheY-like chemotaxis protein
LVELMEGSIGLESEPGKGSTFWFVLPLAVDSEQAGETSNAVSDLAGLRVLIVDDNAVNRRVLIELVTRWGMHGELVASGGEALGALREAHAGGTPFQIALVDMNMLEMDGEMLGRAIKSDAALPNGKEGVEMIRTIPYDVVFMDCQMPVMDGYEAAREVRRTEKPGERRAIVAMTANAMEGDRERCLEAGMDDYVTKPFAAKRWRQR